ncbi:MAG: hypothetical protein HYU83_05935 [Chloroflexi bacterium]|nr:hypothetical protein [Chloroflexota bacterium]
MTKLKILFHEIINAFGRKKHNRALRDILDLQRKIEDFLAKYQLQDKSADFGLVLDKIGQARVESVEITYLARKTIGVARNVRGKHLQPLLRQVYADLEDLKRGLFTRAVRGSSLTERLTQLHNSLKNLLEAVSTAEYK